MIATYFILKLTFRAVLDECNRMAAIAESSERGRALKSQIVQLDLDYENGRITDEEYGRRQASIMDELRRLSAATATGGS